MMLRRAILALIGLVTVAAIAAGVWWAWPRAHEVAEKPWIDLDEWEWMSAQYHRALPSGKSIVEIRLPGEAISSRQRTFNVTVNGVAP